MSWSVHSIDGRAVTIDIASADGAPVIVISTRGLKTMQLSIEAIESLRAMLGAAITAADSELGGR